MPIHGIYALWFSSMAPWRSLILLMFACSLSAESVKEKQLTGTVAELTSTVASLRESNARLQRQHGADTATIKLLKSAIPTLTPETKKDIDTAKEKLGHVEISAAEAAQSASNTEEISGQQLALAKKIHKDIVDIGWLVIAFQVGLAVILSFAFYLMIQRLRRLAVSNVAAELDRSNLLKKMDTSIEHSAEAIHVANNVNDKIATVARDTEAALRDKEDKAGHPSEKR